MKNVVFIPNINLGNGRSTPYHYSIKSWKKWCESNNAILFEWKDAVLDTKSFPITFQRYLVFDILDKHNIEYDQILMVDADTIIHPQCPNFFNETKGEFGVTINNGCYEWVTRSINKWGDSLFPNEQKPKTWEYFNGGFQITNKKHKPFYTAVAEFYQQNIEIINHYRNIIKAGTDQTIINYLTNLYGIKKHHLPECYNLQELFNKNLLHLQGHSYFNDDLIFLDAGWIYHFNGIPPNPSNRDTSYWMERTYKHLYND
jgi:hypothetical protein